MENKKTEIYNEKGTIRISDDVIATVAGIAAAEVEGVSAMSGHWGSDLAEKLGKKNLSKGIKVELTDEQVEISIFIVIQYGYEVPKVALEVQEAVKANVEMMTGLNVTTVNVQVVSIAKPGKTEAPAELPEEKKDKE